MLKRGLIAGLANLIVMLVLMWLIGVVFPSVMQEYKNTAIFRPFNDPLMMVYFGYPFILGFAAAYLWNLLEKHLSGNVTNKALQFAKIYFIIATIPGMFISYTTFQLSFLMIVMWTVTGFIEAFVAGYIFAKVK